MQHVQAGWARLLRTQHGSCSSSHWVTDWSLGKLQHMSTGGPPAAGVHWVFLGPPGVGKGTYASRMAKLLGVAHIATGDLIREQIKAATPVGVQMRELVSAGKLVPDTIIFGLLQQRLEAGKAAGELGFILDGFPRTAAQAHTLLSTVGLQLALNLSLREEVLVEKCLGRRSCTHCGKGYNVADIHLAPCSASGRPEIRMPPLLPPPCCAPHLEIREDDTEPVVRRRLQVYQEQAAPVEDVFRQAGLLLDFEITGGIPETLPFLTAALAPYAPGAFKAIPGAVGHAPTKEGVLHSSSGSASTAPVTRQGQQQAVA